MCIFHGGPASARAHLPKLIGVVLERPTDPGRVSTFVCRCRVAEGQPAMDRRRAIETPSMP